MLSSTDRVDGWEIRPRDHDTFGVYDAHGMLVGPFKTRAGAMLAALRLPKPDEISRQRDLEDAVLRRSPRAARHH
jgi:hypothetical protein